MKTGRNLYGGNSFSRLEDQNTSMSLMSLEPEEHLERLSESNEAVSDCDFLIKLD